MFLFSLVQTLITDHHCILLFNRNVWLNPDYIQSALALFFRPPIVKQLSIFLRLLVLRSETVIVLFNYWDFATYGRKFGPRIKGTVFWLSFLQSIILHSATININKSCCYGGTPPVERESSIIYVNTSVCSKTFGIKHLELRS